MSHKSNHLRTRPAVIAVILALIATTLTVPFAASAAVSSSSLKTNRGSIGDGQSLASLTGAEHSGTQDDWENYIEFMPDSRRHVSIIRLTPEGSGDEVTIDLNYRGPGQSENLWRLQMYDYTARTWVEVFRNNTVDEWRWTWASADFDNADRFLQQNKVRLRYLSKNANDVSQLDYLAATRSGTVVPPTTAPPTTAPPTTQPPTTQPPSGGYALPPVGGGFDYQINGSYTPAADVDVVSRDWFISTADPTIYSICYVNAYQTQPESGGGRPDETSRWPAHLVSGLEDPGWENEFLIDISSAQNRTDAAAHMEQVIDECARKGYEAVEFDNLDSWTRNVDSNFDGVISSGESPWWDIDDAVAYARLLTNYTHSVGLAAAQKNTTDLFANDRHVYAGFDFAVAEDCGRWSECGDFEAAYGRRVYDVEYTNSGFATACLASDRISVVRRDLNVEQQGSPGHYRDTCD